MVQISDINQILKQFEKTVKISIRQSYKDWLKNHYAKLWHLQSILDELKVFLPTNDTGHNLPEELWEEIYKKFSQIISWTENIQYTTEEMSLKSLSNTWQKGFNDTLYGYADKLKLEFNNDLFSLNLKEKNGFKFRKKIYPFIKLIPFNIYGSKTYIRKVELHNFLTQNLETPVTNFILELWEKFLEEISNQYKTIFDKVSELKEKILFIDELKEIQDPFEKFDYFEKIFSIAELLNQADIVLQSLHDSENQFDQFIERKWENIADNILYLWPYAGTFLLPNKKYRTELIAYNKKMKEKSFRKTIKYWQEHFTGVREDWRRNLEIFNLQLQVFKELLGFSKNLITNNELVLIPAFENVVEALVAESKIYKSVTTVKMYRQKLKSTKAQFLDKMQNQLIPQLASAINHVEMLESLDHFIKKLDAANENLSENYIVQKSLQNGNQHSRFKSTIVNLKEIVKTVIFAPFADRFDKNINEVKNRINAIHRSLSEINDIYEVNLESIESFLSNDNIKKVDEPLSLLNTTFKRTKEILEKLSQECKDTLNFSNEVLLNSSKELYLEYQSLTQIDQLLNYNAMFLRQKSQIPLNRIFQKLIDYIKHLFRDKPKKIYNNIKVKIKEAQRIEQTSFEENLIQHSKNAEKNISAIPAVYKRLFTFGTDIDERFYFENKAIIGNIKDAYEKWQNGFNSAVAIIGEIGTGKSSLLNQLEKKIWRNKKINRIYFDTYLNEEKDLLSFLQDTFKLKKTRSFEGLEKKISSFAEGQIVIVDDLHKLYLKTPSGFDLLERFLLFLMNTKKDIFWIIAINFYSWRTLEKILNIKQFIDFGIFLEPFSKEQLRNLIFERNKLSGYKLVFEPLLGEKPLAKLKKTKNNQSKEEYFENRYFDNLHSVSRGNISIAFKYWLLSIKNFKDEYIYIEDFQTIDPLVFKKIRDDDLIAVLPFIEHEKCTIDEYNLMIHKLNHQNNIVLKRFASCGLLDQNKNHFSLNILYYYHLVDVLESKNYLFNSNKKDKLLRFNRDNNQVTVEIYLPVQLDTLHAKQIVFRAVAISQFVNNNKVITTNFINRMDDGQSVLQLQITATLFDLSQKDTFISEITEIIYHHLFAKNIISREDFKTTAISPKN